MCAYNEIAIKHGGYRRKPWPRLASFIKSTKNKFVLELGAGTCSTTKALIENNRVVALDFSFESLKKAPNILKVCADVVCLPFRKASFETIVAVGVLHHLFSKQERLSTLTEANRVLKPKCKALISVWGRAGDKEKLVKWGTYDRYYYFFTVRELEKLAKLAGFSSTCTKKVGRNIFLETTA